MLKKVLLAAIAALILGDLFIFHGRYSDKVAKEAEVVEYQVRDQDWSSPLVGGKG
jgi:hypothetical protein